MASFAARVERISERCTRCSDRRTRIDAGIERIVAGMLPLDEGLGGFVENRTRFSAGRTRIGAGFAKNRGSVERMVTGSRLNSARRSRTAPRVLVGYFLPTRNSNENHRRRGRFKALASISGIAHNTTVPTPRVVLDTNVLVAASRSNRGASAKLLALVGTGRFEICVSVPLLLEYEAVVFRDLEPNSTQGQLWTDILDYLCNVATQQPIFFLWRPYLRDPKDEMVLEAAVAGRCTAIITYNKRDFAGSEKFQLVVRTPKEFLGEIGALA